MNVSANACYEIGLHKSAGNWWQLHEINCSSSATIHPLDEAAKFLVGDGRDCVIIDSGQRKDYDLAIELPLPDLRHLPERSVWPVIYGLVWKAVGLLQ